MKISIVSWGFPRNSGGAEIELMHHASLLREAGHKVTVIGYYRQNECLQRNKWLEFHNGATSKATVAVASSDIVLQFGLKEDGSLFYGKEYCKKMVQMIASDRNKVHHDFHAYYCVSETLRDKVENMVSMSKNVFEYRIPIINEVSDNGINIKRLYHHILYSHFGSSLIDHAHDFVVGTASRLVDFKRIEYIIESANLCKHHKMLFLIAGLGPSIYTDKLHRMVKEYGLEDTVLFLGWLNNEDIISFMKCLKVFLFCGQDEGLPRCISEAMSVGLPIITARFKEAENMLGETYPHIFDIDEEFLNKARLSLLLFYNNSGHLKHAKEYIVKMHEAVCKQYDYTYFLEHLYKVVAL